MMKEIQPRGPFNKSLPLEGDGSHPIEHTNIRHPKMPFRESSEYYVNNSGSSAPLSDDEIRVANLWLFTEMDRYLSHASKIRRFKDYLQSWVEGEEKIIQKTTMTLQSLAHMLQIDDLTVQLQSRADTLLQQMKKGAFEVNVVYTGFSRKDMPFLESITDEFKEGKVRFTEDAPLATILE